MKRNDCSIVQDLLPLYIEDMLQPDTTAYVTDHLSGCATCTAALGDLKTETTSPASDAEEIRKGDQQAMKQLQKTLTTQNIIVCLAAFLFFALLSSPLMGYAGIPWRVETIVLLLTAGPLCATVYVSFRQRALSRNVTLAATGTTLLIGVVPLYFLASFFYKAIYNTLFNPGSYRPDSILEWLGAWMPSYGTSFFLIPASVFGILLAVIVLRDIWSKSLPPQAPFSRPVLCLHRAAPAISLLIVVLHLIPWQFIYHYNGNDYFPLDFSNLLAAGIPLYITAATALAEISSKKHAQVASVLSLAMPGYVLLTLLSHWNSAWSHPIYAVLLLVLPCLLTAIALQSIWAKRTSATESTPFPDTAANASADAPALGAEHACQPDRQASPSRKKALTIRYILLGLILIICALHLTPWAPVRHIYQGRINNTMLHYLLVFTLPALAPPVYFVFIKKPSRLFGKLIALVLCLPLVGVAIFPMFEGLQFFYYHPFQTFEMLLPVYWVFLAVTLLFTLVTMLTILRGQPKQK